MKIKIDGYTKREINAFVKELARANTIIYDAIIECESIVHKDIFNTLRDGLTEHEELAKAIAKQFLIIKKRDSDFARPQTSESYFQDYEEVIGELSDYL